MKKRIIAMICGLAFSIFASASEDASFRAIAENHLKNLQISGQELELDQETDLSLFYISDFASGNEEYPCHVGVVVDKASRKITLGEGDLDLSFSFAYSDTYMDRERKVIEICAD